MTDYSLAILLERDIREVAELFLFGNGVLEYSINVFMPWQIPLVDAIACWTRSAGVE
ncbi:hypothetical protein [Paraburkholderia sp. RL17-373-BIF-A]|uniref:hypothetical protein n=1 Tax=Paraburkholderia sp. RL17-373-BIF-A TaxID=3031629 RepID=UPI0038B8BED4